MGQWERICQEEMGAQLPKAITSHRLCLLTHRLAWPGQAVSIPVKLHARGLRGLPSCGAAQTGSDGGWR